MMHKYTEDVHKNSKYKIYQKLSHYLKDINNWKSQRENKSHGFAGWEIWMMDLKKSISHNESFNFIDLKSHIS